MSANGYAACHNGSIYVDTVSSHDRAAMVNWLVVHAGYMVPNGMGDFAIREHFEHFATPGGVTIEPVTITQGD